MALVVGPDHGPDVFAAGLAHLPALLHELAHGVHPEQALDVAVVPQPARAPDELDETAPVHGPVLDADAHLDAEDGGRGQKFPCHGQIDAVVVDHGQVADALDPGVHDQMGGGLAPLLLASCTRSSKAIWFHSSGISRR